MKQLALALVLFISICGPASADPWGPWSTSPDAPTIRNADDRSIGAKVIDEPAVPSVAAAPFLWTLRFYQSYITQVDGDRCVMYPTCSQYSVASIRKHGPVMGIIMTSDRLIHEWDEQKTVPLIKVGNRWRYNDPVKNNDFWWSE